MAINRLQALFESTRNPIALRYAVSKGVFSDLLGTLSGLLGGGGPRQADRDTRDLLQVVKISYDCASTASPTGGSDTRSSPPPSTCGSRRSTSDS